MSRFPTVNGQKPGGGPSQDRPAFVEAPINSQADRPLQVTTPLGDDVFLLTGFSGFEALSQLSQFHLILAAPDQTVVDFDRLMGGEVTVHLRLPGGGWRHFGGICIGLTQGLRHQDYTYYEMDVVPALWKLTRTVQSRIFQHKSVAEILEEVLADIPHAPFDFEFPFQPRDHCIQYRESDFAFASRLMEDEGIFYYFVQKADRHEMVVTNRQAFPALDPETLVLQQIVRPTDDTQRVDHWEKQQRLRSGRVTLRDRSFQLPDDSLESATTIQESVTVGQIPHRLDAGPSASLEIYQWPGEFAPRFDGIGRGGQPLGAAELGKIADDGNRTAEIRMQQVAAEAIQIQGRGNYRHLAPGSSFHLQERPTTAYDGSSSHDGDYVLTSVDHRCEVGMDYRSGDTLERFYSNRFTCIPIGLPYRPPRQTPRPSINGPQTAVVVKGPGGDEIFTDPYGRVKVKFYWDRKGIPDPDSSCWIRVSQPSSGTGFGMIYVPRGGQEVVVEFEDGDPDRPLITGSVYNPNQMPPFELPAGKMKSGFRSNTYPHGGGLNEITVDDTKNGERMYLHAQYNQDTVVGNNRTLSVAVDDREQVKGNHHETINGESREKIVKDMSLHVQGMASTWVQQDAYNEVDGNLVETIKGHQAQRVIGETWLHAQRIVIEASAEICLMVGTNFVRISAGGVEIEGTIVNVNCGHTPSSSAPASGLQSKPPKEPALP